MPSETTTESDSDSTDTDHDAADPDVLEPTEVHDADAADVADEFDAQEWTLGEERTGVIEFNGMKFKLREPETDQQVAELVSPSASAAKINKRAIKILVEKPDLTDDQIDEQMTPKERAMLANEAMEWYGVDDFIDEDAMAEALAERAQQDAADDA